MQNEINKQNLFLQGVTVQEFKELLTDLMEEQLGRKLGNIIEFGDQNGSFKVRSSKSKDDTKYLTRGEVSKQLQISLPTLHNYVKQGLLKSYRIGGKVRFKANEIEQSLTERNFTAVNRKGGISHA